MTLRKRQGWWFVAFTMIASPSIAHARDDALFYKGKTVTIAVGSTPGGGYDVYARLLARYLGKYIPGQPTVVVSNMPGAASEVGAAYVARVAPKDGTYISAPQATQPLDPILQDATKLDYDPSRMNYLGSAVSDDYVCLVRPDAPAVSFGGMFKTQVILGGGDPDSQMAYFPIMLDNVLGTKFKLVMGYPGSSEIMLAFQNHEIQGMCGIGWTSLKSQYPNLLKSGLIKIIAQENEKGVPQLNGAGIPLTFSYAHTPKQREILDIVYSQEDFARPYFVAAEVPPDRVKILRQAFLATWRDPNLLADAAKMNLDIGPKSGEEIQSRLQKIYASPPALLKEASEAIKEK
jgi:tripartite-type tricarboxylate transporter receptor subunit TctC